MVIKHTSTRASALLLALFTAAILAALGGAAFTIIQSHYRHAHQVAGWEETLQAAEAGVDLAVAELRRTLYDKDAAFSQGDGWDIAPMESAEASGLPPSLLPASTSEWIPRKITTFISGRQTEGGSNSQATVTVDAPFELVDTRDEQWYRIRSTAYADVPGSGIVANSKEDRALRAIDLRQDRETQEALVRPRATRRIEAIVKPVGAFSKALFATDGINMNNHNIVVDSYDSRDPKKSTNGKYDPAKRQKEGDIATNGKVIDAGQAHIYGDAATNGGTVLRADNVTGDIQNDFFQETFNVQDPNVTADIGSPSGITGTTTVVAKPGSPTQLRLSTISLSGKNTLTIQGAPNGSTTYCQIVVRGNISLGGQAQLIIGKGVKVRIFVAGNADMGGNGVLNNNEPLNLQLYGLDKPKNADGTTPLSGEIKIAGNGGFKGCVYAPNYNVEMVGGGNSDSIFGAFVAKGIRMTGVQSVHYDEALSEGGLISDYRIVSWIEDAQFVRKTAARGTQN